MTYPDHLHVRAIHKHVWSSFHLATFLSIWQTPLYPNINTETQQLILSYQCTCERGKYWLTFFLIDKYVASISSGNFMVVRYGRKVIKPRNFPKSLSVNKLEIKTSLSSCKKVKQNKIKNGFQCYCTLSVSVHSLYLKFISFGIQTLEFDEIVLKENNTGQYVMPNFYAYIIRIFISCFFFRYKVKRVQLEK